MASERKFVTENIRRVLLKEYLMKAVDRAGFGGVEVEGRVRRNVASARR